MQKFKLFHFQSFFFLFLYTGLLLFSGGHIYHGDGESMYATARSIFEQGELAISPEKGGIFPDTDGKFHGRYPLGVSIALQPFLLISRMAAAVLPVSENHLSRFIALQLNLLATALTALLLLRFSLKLGCSLQTALVPAVGFTFLTGAWHHSQTLFSEPVLSLLLFYSVYALYFRKSENALSHIILSGLAFGCAIHFKNVAVVLAPALVFYIYRTTGLFKKAVPFLVLVLLFGIAGLVVNGIKYGSLFKTGYHDHSNLFHCSYFLSGLWTQLFSADRSFFLYNPITVVCLFCLPRFLRQHRELGVTSLLFIGITVLFYSIYRDVRGGWGFGPRFPVILLPFFMLWLVELKGLIKNPRNSRKPGWRTAGLSAIAAASLLVQLLSVLVNPNIYTRMTETLSTPREKEAFIAPIPAHAVILLHKLQGKPEIYDISQFTDLDYKKQYDLREFETYRGIDIWPVLFYTHFKSGWIAGVLYGLVFILFILSGKGAWKSGGLTPHPGKTGRNINNGSQPAVKNRR